MKYLNKIIIIFFTLCFKIIGFENYDGELEFSRLEHVYKENLDKLCKKYKYQKKTKIKIDFLLIDDEKDSKIILEKASDAYMLKGRYPKSIGGKVKFFREIEENLIKNLKDVYLTMLNTGLYIFELSEIKYITDNCPNIKSLKILNNDPFYFNISAVENVIDNNNSIVKFGFEPFKMHDAIEYNDNGHISFLNFFDPFTELMCIIKKNKSIKSLSIYNYFYTSEKTLEREISDKIYHSISKNKTLEKISFKFCSINTNVLLQLISDLSESKSLKKIIFYDYKKKLFGENDYKKFNLKKEIKQIIAGNNNLEGVFFKEKIEKTKRKKITKITNVGNFMKEINNFFDLKFSFKS